ncbi:acylneuraminate cytidylyltransferase family protein [Litoricolaceae bacterium]|nr:acylneuraminate cytidylyltransferase family protein [Litorivicinaceae bacterium]
MKTLALVPARGGSKGILGKNLKVLGGRPLIVWTIDEVKKSRFRFDIVCSSDHDETLRLAEAKGVHFIHKRSGELSQDSSAMFDVVKDIAEDHRYSVYDGFMILQPTSPFRTAANIDAFYDFVERKQPDSAVTVSRVNEHPNWMFYKDCVDQLRPVLQDELCSRRQDLPEVYKLNGAVFWVSRGWVERSRTLVADGTFGVEIEGMCALDIDNELDWEEAVQLASCNLN